jgi:hypothetical protein
MTVLVSFLADIFCWLLLFLVALKYRSQDDGKGNYVKIKSNYILIMFEVEVMSSFGVSCDN